MKSKPLAVVLILALFSPEYATQADTASQPIVKTIGQLLAEGYQIQSVTVIDQAIAKRMSGNDSWQDDLMLTLVKGGDFAFCHFALGVVTTGVGLKSGTCNVAQ